MSYNNLYDINENVEKLKKAELIVYSNRLVN